MKRLLILASLLSCWACSEQADKSTGDYATETLVLEKLSSNVIQHISYLELSDGQLFPCNGMVYMSDGEAIVFDSPASLKASEELLVWLEQEAKVKVKALVVNHFHNDCLGGISAFHKRGIPSYAQEQTLTLAKVDSVEVPLNRFSNELELLVGNHRAITSYFGPGHSPDNVVSYLPDEAVLFGGCLVKSLGAGKGNLADADTLAWAETVRQVKSAYPNLVTVVPGHGEIGDSRLLDYTMQLFSDAK